MPVRRRQFILLFLILFSFFAVAQNTINVPGDQPTIQSAIDAAQPGDTVVVAPGEYYENLNFHGKAIVVRASMKYDPVTDSNGSALNGDQSGPVILFNNGETSASVLDGFLIRNGGLDPSLLRGAGIYIDGASPTIQNNYLTANTGCDTVAIFANASSAIIRNNTIGVNGTTDQSCHGDGAGVLATGQPGPDSPGVQITGNWIWGNFTNGGHGAGVVLNNAGIVTVSSNRIQQNSGGPNSGIHINGSNVTLTNNLISNNSGGGLSIGENGTPSLVLVTNNTVANNQDQNYSGYELTLYSSSTAQFFNNIIYTVNGYGAIQCSGGSETFGFNDIYATNGGGWPGCDFQAGVDGNLSVDPEFIGLLGTSSLPNYTVHPASPTIDAGANSADGIPSLDFEDKARILDGNSDGTAVADIGACEYSPIVSFAPTYYDFGLVPLSSTSTKQVLVTALAPVRGLQFSSTVDPFTPSGEPVNPSDLSLTSDCPATMQVGDKCALNLSFTPTTTTVISRYHILAWQTTADDTAEFAVSGQGQNTSFGIAQLSETSVDFGNLPFGTSATRDVTITNTGTVPLLVGPISATGSRFTTMSDCGSRIDPGLFCNVNVSFFAGAYGDFDGILSIQTWDSGANAYITQAVSLHASVVVPELSLAPQALHFDQVEVGTTVTQSVTVSNISTVTASINGISPNPSGPDFKESDTCRPQLLGGASCSITISYKPSSRTSASVVYSIYSNEANSPRTLYVSANSVIRQLSADPSTTSYLLGDVQLGSQVTKAITLRNSGDLVVTLGQATLAGADYSMTTDCGSSLAVGARCKINITFQPTSRGTESAVLNVPNDASGGSLTFNFSGRGVTSQMQVLPLQLSFDSQVVGSLSTAQPVTVSNTGDFAISLTGAITTSAPFRIVSNNCGFLQPGQQCVVLVGFAPTWRGAVSGSLYVYPGVPSNVNVSLTGRGIAPVSTLVPSALDFGNQQVNSTSPAKQITLTNSGDSTMHLSSISSSHAAFAQTNTCGATLEPGASCTVNVTFTPSAGGALSASLNIQADTVPTISSSPLTGKGIVGSPSLSNGGKTWTGQNVGTSSPSVPVTLTNTGSGVLAITNIGITGPFTATSNCPATLGTQANCTINVAFTPTVQGTVSGTLTVETDGSPATVTAAYTGTGTVPVATLSASNIVFGNVLIGSGASNTVRMTNTGDGPMSISGVSLAGTGFSMTNHCSGTLEPGSSCNVTVSFQPTAHTNYNGSITFQDSASGSPQAVQLSGAGVEPIATLSITSLSFGNVQLGTSTSNAVTVTNNGDAALNISGISVFPTAFTQAGNCPTSLSPGSSCTLTVTFTPTSTGVYSGSLVISDNATPSQQVVSLGGTGVSAVASFNPSALNFGKYTVGSTVQSNVGLINTGTVAMSVSSITTSGDFSQTNSCPATLAVNASCTITVVFKPTGGGTRVGSLVVNGNLPGGSQSLPLSGTGVDFVISANPASLTVARKSTGTSTVTLSSIGGTFPSSVSLACGGLPTGTSCSYSPSSIASGGTSSTLTIKSANNTPVGSYTITIKGTSGALIRSTSVSLTVQ